MVKDNRSSRRLRRRLSRLILIGLPALLGLVLIAVALAISGDGDSVPLPEDLGSFQEEATQVLSSAEGGTRLRIPEEELSRLGAAAFQEMAEQSGGVFSVFGFTATAGTGRITPDLAFRVLLPQGLPIGRIETTASFGFDVETRNGALLLTPSRLRLGRLPLPPSLLVTAYGRAASRGMLRESPIKLIDGAFVLPLDLLNENLPRLVRLTAVKAVPGGVDLLMDVDSATAMTLLSETAPLLDHVLPGLRRTLLDEGIDVDLDPLEDAAHATGGSAGVPEPAALVSYIENDVVVLFEEETFVPEIGEDLYAQSSVRTGESSATELLLRDRSVLRISEETEFKLRALPAGTGDGTELQLASGRLRAKVNKIIADDAQFTVRAGTAVLGVRGTDIFVNLEPEKELTVAVLEGSVTLVPKGGTETVLGADRELSVTVDDLSEPLRHPLETQALDPKRREEIEANLKITTSPDDQDGLREQYRVSLIIEELRRLAATVATMTAEEQQRLSRNLQRQIDPAWVEQEFDRLMANPQFAELMVSFGVDELDLR